MIIIHAATNPPARPRFVARTLAERLRVMPAIVLAGARQTGKSTLAQELVPSPRRDLSLDDLDVAEAARRDADVRLGGPEPVPVDEVQRAPELLRAVKRASGTPWWRVM